MDSDGHADGDLDGYFYGYVDLDRYLYADVYSDSDRYNHSHGYGDRHPNPDEYKHADGDPVPYAHFKRDPNYDRDCHRDRNVDIDGPTLVDLHSYLYLDLYPHHELYGNLFANSDRYPHFHLDHDGNPYLDAYLDLDMDFHHDFHLHRNENFHEYLDLDTYLVSDSDPDTHSDLYGHADFYANIHGSLEVGKNRIACGPEGGRFRPVRPDTPRNGERGFKRDIDGCVADGVDPLHGGVCFGAFGNGDRQYRYMDFGHGESRRRASILLGSGGSRNRRGNHPSKCRACHELVEFAGGCLGQRQGQG